jgi:DNA polymerase-3 subunit alpha
VEGQAGPTPLLVTGTLEEGEPPKILVRDVMRLDQAESRLTAEVRMRVATPDVTRDRLVALRGVLQKHPGDCAAFLHIMIPGESETIVSVGGIRGVNATDGLCRDIDALFGRPVTERGL